MSTLPLYLFAIFGLYTCQAQSDRHTAVGGPCEGCEALHEYGAKVLRAVDTLPEFGSQKLKLTGTVYQKDGRTPAQNVILYIYHTNRSGAYARRGNETGWARNHGYIRGWIKTGSDGKYTFYTFIPAAYPDGSEPQHIHITVKEPLMNEYYIDDFVFQDDPLLTAERRRKLPKRGGSGIVRLEAKGDLLVAQRNIYLGRNIPNYP